MSSDEIPLKILSGVLQSLICYYPQGAIHRDRVAGTVDQIDSAIQLALNFYFITHKWLYIWGTNKGRQSGWVSRLD